MTDKQKAVAGQTAQEVQEATAEPQAVADQKPLPEWPARLILEQDVKADLEKIREITENAIASLREAINTGQMLVTIEGRTVKDSLSFLDEWITRAREGWKREDSLLPFIVDELISLRQKAGNADITIYDLFLETRHPKPEGGDEIDNLMRRAEERAAAAEMIPLPAEAEATATGKLTVKHLEALPRITATMTSALHYPVDKPNSKIWRWLETANGNGQMRFSFEAGKNAPIYYGINFDALDAELKITKQLNPFDKRVYIAAAALYNAGNEVISATQIHKMMGNKEQPAPNQTKKINDSLTKMGAARIYLSNEKEKQVNKKYPLYRYDGALLPFERISAYINNTLTDAAIHLFREPPLVDFARKRQQVTTISRQLLESPVSKTEKNLQLEDYLLERIAHMKSPKSKAPRKMLISTIYEKSGITTKKQRDRALEKIRQYLDHYKETGWIKGYTIGKDSVTIHL